MTRSENGGVGIRKSMFHEFFDGEDFSICKYEPTAQGVCWILCSMASEMEDRSPWEFLKNIFDGCILAIEI